MQTPTKSQALRQSIKLLFFSWLFTIACITAVFVSSFFGKNGVTPVPSPVVGTLIVTGMVSFSALWVISILTAFRKTHRAHALKHLLWSGVIGVLWLAGIAALLIISERYEDAHPTPYLQQPTASNSAELSSDNTATYSAAVVKKPVEVDPYANNEHLKDAEWGKAVEIAPHTYQMKIQQDSTMGTPEEIFAALNVYRNAKGTHGLSWDDKLAQLARERVVELSSDTYAHEGFKKRQEQESFWDTYGVRGIGENASQNYRLSGTHLIEWLYASDHGHDSNQLNPQWNHVGIATSGSDSVLIFGAK